MDKIERQMRQNRRSKRRPESHCYRCTNAIFEEQLGEYKCKILKRRIRNPEEHTGCKDYKKA